MASPSLLMTTTAHMSSHYKGKVTRSWPQLPPELIRHIATFYLSDASIHNYCPKTWDIRELWHPRMVYTALRDAQDLEKLMTICPQWHIALEHHYFWQQAVSLIDPLDLLVHHAIVPHPQTPQQGTPQNRPSHPRSPQQQHNSSTQHVPPTTVTRLSPHVHFRNVVNCSCIVCRINTPNTSLGLAHARRQLPSPFLGPIGLCREHDRNKNSFCGLCLREGREAGALGALSPTSGVIGAQGFAPALIQAQHQVAMVGCLENEDELTFPGIFATCRSCRYEHLWDRASLSVRSILALGGTPRNHGKPALPKQVELDALDWETRQVLDAFIDMAEGSVSDVLTIATEKRWLRKYTRLTDMLGQALAAQRFNNGGGVDQRVRSAAPIRRSGDYADARGNTGERGGLRREEDQSGEGWVNQDTPDDATSLSGYSGSESDEDEEGGKEQRQRSVQGGSPQSRPRDQREPQQRHNQASSPQQQQRQPHSMYPANDIQFVEDDGDDLDLEEDEEEEDDDEDPELLQLTEESGVKELAMGDWARTRILDGFWISPVDLWAVRSSVYDGRRRRQVLMKSLTKIRAVHPVPWAHEEEEPRREEKCLEDKGWETQSDPGFDSDEEEAGDRNSRSPISRSRHPKRSTVRASIPPSQALCELAYQAHQQQMRAVLLAPMRNIVRKVVMESQEAAGWRVGCEDLRRRRRQAYQHGDVDGTADEEGLVDGRHITDEDPVLRVSRMTLEDVVSILRDEEGVWFDGVNWAEKRRNERLREREQMILKRRKAAEQHDELIGGADGHGASASSTVSPQDGASTTSSGPGSGLDSESTSPVLSIVTLQTTPSPPPADGDAHPEEKRKLPSHVPSRMPVSQTMPIDVLPIATWMPAPLIALSPVLNPPKLLRPIPYIPTTVKGLPEFTIEAINSIWREACEPLYHCQCMICQRAVVKANAEAALAAFNSNAANYARIQPQQVRPVTVPSHVGPDGQLRDTDPAQIVQLREVGDDEREHLVAQAREEEEEEEEYEEEEESVTSGEVRRAYEEEEEDDVDSLGVRYTEEYEEEVIEVVDEEAENDDARSDFDRREGSPRLTSSPRKTTFPSAIALTSTAKKRSVSAMQNEEGGPDVSRDGNANPRERTPPKRARTHGSDSDAEDSASSTSSSSFPASRSLLARRGRRPSQPLTPSRSRTTTAHRVSTTSRSTEPTPVPSSSPVQVRKRSSEELEDLEDPTISSANSNVDDNGSDQSSVKGNKRIKVIPSPLPSPRLSPRRRTPRSVAAMQTGSGHRTNHNQPLPALKLETEGLYVIGDED